MRRHSPTRALAFVYIARDEETGLVKVGYSVDPLHRLVGLRSSSAHPITLLAASEGGVHERGTLEHALHRALYETHAHGEWFHPSPFLQRCVEACSSTLPDMLPETPEEALLVRLTEIDEAWATLTNADGAQDPRLALVDAAALKAKRHHPAHPPLRYARSAWSPDAAAYWHEWVGLL